MQLALSPLRILVLLALLAGFWAIGGFHFPDERFLQRPWLYSVLIVSGGAISATVIDHWVGSLDRTNLRMMYVLLGVLLMGGGLLYQGVLKERMKIEKGDPPAAETDSP